MIQKDTLENIPKARIVFSTERLIARELHPGDAENLFRLNADPEVMRHTGDKPFASLGEARQFLESYRPYETEGFGRWALELKQGHAFIGWCGLKRHDTDWADLGFRLATAYWGNGYATEAGRASLEIGFVQHGLREIIGRAAVANTASRRVLEKLNMRFWKWGSCEGIPFATYYRITSSEYSPLHSSIR